VSGATSAAVVPLRDDLPDPNTPPAADDLAAPQFYDRPTAARQLGVGTTTLDALIASGDLAAVRIGRRVLIHVDDLAAYVARLRVTSRGRGGCRVTLSPEHVRTFDTIALRVGDPYGILGSHLNADESMSNLAARVAKRGDLPVTDVSSLFDALLDAGFGWDGAHGDGWE